MKCALHVHTNLSDGALSPEEMLKVYADLGFGCVAITDHEFLLKEDYWSRVKSADPCGMTVLIGVEADYQPWHYHHLLRILGERQTLHVLCHPASYYLEVPEVVARLSAEPFHIDAVEITHRGFYTPLYDQPAVPVPKIASDDAHEPQEIGRAWIELPETRDPDQVIRAVKAGDFQVGFFRNYQYSAGRK